VTTRGRLLYSVAIFEMTVQVGGPAIVHHLDSRVTTVVFVDTHEDAPVHIPGAVVLGHEVVVRRSFLLPGGTGPQVHPDGGCHVYCGASGRPSGLSVHAAPSAVTSPLDNEDADGWSWDAIMGGGRGEGATTGAMALTQNSGDAAMANTRKKRRQGSKDVTMRP